MSNAQSKRLNESQRPVANYGTADDFHKLIIPQNTTSNLAQINPKEVGSLAYDTTLNQVVVNNGSGFVSVTPTVPVVTVSAEENLGSLTWTGGTPPSGTISKTYRWSKVGQQITFYAKITASVAGATVTELDFTLPADVPPPAMWATQESSGRIINGSGALSSSLTTIATTNAQQCVLLDNGAGGYTIKIVTAGSQSTLAAWAQLSWIAAS